MLHVIFGVVMNFTIHSIANFTFFANSVFFQNMQVSEYFVPVAMPTQQIEATEPVRFPAALDVSESTLSYSHPPPTPLLFASRRVATKRNLTEPAVVEPDVPVEQPPNKRQRTDVAVPTTTTTTRQPPSVNQSAIATPRKTADKPKLTTQLLTVVGPTVSSAKAKSALVVAAPTRQLSFPELKEQLRLFVRNEQLCTEEHLTALENILNGSILKEKREMELRKQFESFRVGDWVKATSKTGETLYGQVQEYKSAKVKLPICWLAANNILLPKRFERPSALVKVNRGFTPKTPCLLNDVGSKHAISQCGDRTWVPPTVKNTA